MRYCADDTRKHTQESRFHWAICDASVQKNGFKNPHFTPKWSPVVGGKFDNLFPVPGLLTQNARPFLFETFYRELWEGVITSRKPTASWSVMQWSQGDSKSEWIQDFSR